jgi:hypothetical protein
LEPAAQDIGPPSRLKLTPDMGCDLFHSAGPRRCPQSLFDKFDRSEVNAFGLLQWAHKPARAHGYPQASAEASAL